MGPAPSRFRNDDQEQTMRMVANENKNGIKARDPTQNQGSTENEIPTIGSTESGTGSGSNKVSTIREERHTNLSIN